MISIQQSDCSSFCPTFSFRIEDMPILLQFSHHAVCSMACCEVQMTIHTGSVGGGYGLPLIPRKQNTWQQIEIQIQIYIQNMTLNTNIDTNVSSGSAGGDSLPLLLRQPGRKALLWSSRLPGGELSPRIIITLLLPLYSLFGLQDFLGMRSVLRSSNRL